MLVFGDVMFREMIGVELTNEEVVKRSFAEQVGTRSTLHSVSLNDLCMKASLEIVTRRRRLLNVVSQHV